MASYRGKPSLGCGTCRNRHIKCDNTRPTCLRCQKSDRVCLGYREWGELWVRDQTQLVSNRFNVATSEVVETKPRPSVQKKMPLITLPFPKDQLAIGHFFATRVNSIPASSGSYAFLRSGYVDTLTVLYANASPYSPLASATLALAFAAFRVDHGGMTWMQGARTNYHLTLGRLREVLKSEEGAKSDATLTAVFFMQAIECLINRSDPSQKLQYHRDGATALIKFRGHASFQDPRSRELLGSCRSFFIMRDCRQYIEHDSPVVDIPNPDMGVPFLEEDEGPDCRSSEGSLLYLTGRVTASCEEAKHLLSKQRTARAIQYAQKVLRRLYERDESLHRWSQSVPQPFPADAGVIATVLSIDDDEDDDTDYDEDDDIDAFVKCPYWGRVDCYDNLDLAWNWNRCRLARLMVHETILRVYKWLDACEADRAQFFNSKANEIFVSASKRVLQELVDDICASTPFILGKCDPRPSGGRVYIAFATLYGAQGVSIVNKIQQQWILTQMLIISRVIGLYKAPAGRNILRRLETLRESAKS